MSDRIDVPALPRPMFDGRSRAVDAAITTALLLPVLVFPFTSVPRSTTLLSFIEIVPLLMRRVQPAGCFYTVTAATALQLALVDTPIWGQVAMPVAVYAVAAYENKALSRVALVASLVAGVVAAAVWVAGDQLPAQQLALWFSAPVLLLVAAWALGSMVKAQRAYAAEVVSGAERLEREAALKSDLAAADERAQASREVQEVVTHGLTVMVMHAEGARYTVTSHPEEAAHALESIADTGRDCLAETRRVQQLLASEEGEPGTAPRPGLGDLSALVGHAEETGMRITADLAQPMPAVPDGTGLAAYRIVQEGLANVRKHAGPATSVHVSARVIGSDLVVEVLDDGHDADAGPEQIRGTGRGLAGPRERVDMHGGHLEAGPRAGGGFAVRARLPLSAAAQA